VLPPGTACGPARICVLVESLVVVLWAIFARGVGVNGNAGWFEVRALL